MGSCCRYHEDNVIAGVVPSAGLGLIVGMYGTAKSFFTLHMAACASQGLEFFGREVREKVGVLYICAESPGTFDRRIAAHKFTRNAALGFIFSAMDFGKPPIADDLRDLVAQIHAINNAGTFGAPIRLIFIDTLARSGLQNENDSEAMGYLIDNLDAVSREVNAVCIGIHHQGWEAEHSRGHSSLPGAVDFEITLSKNGETFVAGITKSRDGVTGDKFPFKLDVVRVAPVSDDEWLTSCLVVPLDEVSPPTAPRKKLNPDQKIALDVLVRVVEEEGYYPSFGGLLAPKRRLSASCGRKPIYRPSNSPRTMRRTTGNDRCAACANLQGLGFVRKKGRCVWPVMGGGQGGQWADNSKLSARMGPDTLRVFPPVRGEPRLSAHLSGVQGIEGRKKHRCLKPWLHPVGIAFETIRKF